MEPHISEDPKGQSASRLNESKEPAQDEEKRRIVEKLIERDRVRCALELLAGRPLSTEHLCEGACGSGDPAGERSPRPVFEAG